MEVRGHASAGEQRLPKGMCAGCSQESRQCRIRHQPPDSSNTLGGLAGQASVNKYHRNDAGGQPLAGGRQAACNKDIICSKGLLT